MKKTKTLTESSYSDRTTHKLELNFLSLSNYEIKRKNSNSYSQMAKFQHFIKQVPLIPTNLHFELQIHKSLFIFLINKPMIYIEQQP